MSVLERRLRQLGLVSAAQEPEQPDDLAEASDQTDDESPLTRRIRELGLTSDARARAGLYRPLNPKERGEMPALAQQQRETPAELPVAEEIDRALARGAVLTIPRGIGGTAIMASAAADLFGGASAAGVAAKAGQPLPPVQQSPLAQRLRDFGTYMYGLAERAAQSEALRPSRSVTDGKRDLRWWLSSGVEGIGQVAGQVGLAVAAAPLGPVGAFAAFAAPVAGQEAAEQYVNLTRGGVSPEVATGAAFITGVLNSAVERFSFVPQILARVPFTRQVMANTLVGHIARRGVSAVTEGIEESVQTAVAAAVEYAVTKNPDAVRDLLPEIATSFGVGAIAGGGAPLASASVAAELQRHQERRRATRPAQPQPAVPQPPAAPTAARPEPEPVTQVVPQPTLPTLATQPQQPQAEPPAAGATQPESAPAPTATAVLEPEPGAEPEAETAAGPQPATTQVAVPVPEEDEAGRASSVPVARTPEEVQAGRVYVMPIAWLEARPEQMQYKVTGRAAQSRALEEAAAYDPDFAGVLTAWKEPDTGTLIIVNGHNRHRRALELGVESHLVRVLGPNVRTAQEARARGALINIAEGQGTSIDAAKFFRDSGLGPDEIRKYNIPLTGQRAQEGLALARLHPVLFDEVWTRRMPLDHGIIIGRSGLTEAQQLALVETIRNRRDRLSADELEQLIIEVRGSPQIEATQETLFGAETFARSLFVEKAKLANAVAQEIAEVGRGAKAIKKGKRAKKLAQKNVAQIDVERAGEVAAETAQLVELWNTLRKSGPLAEALNNAAIKLSEGGKLAEIVDELVETVVPILEAERGKIVRAAERTPDQGTGRGLQEADTERGGTDAEPAQTEQIAGAEAGPDLFGGVEQQTSLLEEPDEQPAPAPDQTELFTRRAGPQRLSEAETEARQVVSVLRDKVARGEVTPEERERYRDALALLRRHEAYSEEELRLRGEPTQPAAHGQTELFERRRLVQHLVRTFGSIRNARRVASVVQDAANSLGLSSHVSTGTPRQTSLLSTLLQSTLPGIEERARTVEEGARQFRQALTSISPIGLQISNPASFYRVAHLFRDPSAEHLHAWFLDDKGVVLGHSVITSGVVDWVSLDPLRREIAKIGDKVGATEIIISHNHPSGHSEPSAADIQVTRTQGNYLEKLGYRFRGQYVIDHETFSFIPYGDEENWVSIKVPADVKPTNFSFGLPRMPLTHEGAKELFGALRETTAPHQVQVVWQSGGDKPYIMGVELVPPDATADRDALAIWIQQHARRIGASIGYILVGTKKQMLELTSHARNLVAENELRGNVYKLTPTQRQIREGAYRIGNIVLLQKQSLFVPSSWAFTLATSLGFTRLQRPGLPAWLERSLPAPAPKQPAPKQMPPKTSSAGPAGVSEESRAFDISTGATEKDRLGKAVEVVIPVWKGHRKAKRRLVLRPVRPVELVRIVERLIGTDRVVVSKLLQRFGTRGLFRAAQDKEAIVLNPELGKDYWQFVKTLAHEIGHMIDYLPDRFIDRGNILGRIASLRKYLQETIDAVPTYPSRALTAKDRAKIRRQAAKLVGKRPKDPEQLEKWKKQVAEQYRDLIKDEIQRRGLLTREEIHEELLMLSEWWRGPIGDNPNFRRYRTSSVELYADALSVLLNDPAALQDRAPAFFDAWIAYLERKPDVRLVYRSVLRALADPVRMFDERREERRGDYERFEAKRRAYEQGGEPRQKFGNYLKQLLLDKAAPFERRSIRRLIHELNHADNDNEVMASRIYKFVHEPLTRAGITEQDISDYLMMKRIAEGDRGGLAEEAKKLIMQITGEEEWPAAREKYKELLALQQAGVKAKSEADEEIEEYDPALLQLAESGLLNPRGYTPDEAKAELRALRKRLGEERWQTLEAGVRRLRRLIWPSVERAAELGIYSKAAFQRIRQNKDTYAPFVVIDYFTGAVSPTIRKQIGTVKSIGPAYTTLLLKAMALNRLNAQQWVRLNIRSILDTDFPGMAGEERAISPFHRETRPPRGRGNLWYFVDGRIHYREVDDYIVNALERADLGSLERITRVLNSKIYGFFHPLYVTWSFAWQIRNIRRDMKKTFKGLAKAHAGKLWYYQVLAALKDWVRLKGAYARTLRIALRRAKGLYDPWVNAMLADKALTRPFSSFEVDPEGSTIERIMQRYKLMETTPNTLRRKLKLLGRPVEAIGVFQETWSKAAAYKLLGEMGITGDDRAEIVREYVGTPDSKVRGLASDAVNAIWMYSNIILSGLRADADLATNRATAPGYWFRSLITDFIPKLFMVAAAKGWLDKVFDDDDEDEAEHWNLSDWYAHIPSYDLEKYIVLPVPPFWSSNERGERKAVYIRLPHDDTNRMLAGVTWALLNRHLPNRIGRAASNLVGELPGLNPVIEAGTQFFSAVSGKNPYDYFRGREIVPRDSWEAGGWPRWKEMVRHWARDLGVISQMLGRWLYTAPDQTDASTAELWARSVPWLSAIVGVSDRGIDEIRWWDEERDRALSARIRLDLGHDVRRLLAERYRYNTFGMEQLSAIERRRRLALNAWYGQIYRPLTDLMEMARDQERRDVYERARDAIRRSAEQMGRLK